MWPKEYEDYPVDAPLTKYPVETGKGIVGCEMHDLNGWGISHHQCQSRKKKSWFAKLLSKLTKK